MPDNLKSAIHRASFYDPETNPTYGRMAAHYGVGIVPARPYKPRDKASHVKAVPKDDEARMFYERFDFVPAPTDPRHLFLLLKDVRALLRTN